MGSLLAAGGLSAVALGQGTSYLVLTLAGTLAYVGVNIVMTAARNARTSIDPTHVSRS